MVVYYDIYKESDGYTRCYEDAEEIVAWTSLNSTFTIQSAITAVGTEGAGEILMHNNLAEDEYNIDLITFVDNLLFEGESQAGVRFQFNGSAGLGPVVFELAYCENTDLSTFTLDGNKSGCPNVSWVCGAIRFNHSSSCEISSVIVNNATRYAIYTWDSDDIDFVNCEAYYTTDNGLGFWSTNPNVSYSANCRILGGEVAHASDVGVCFISAQDSEINDVYVHDIDGNDSVTGYNDHFSVSWEGTYTINCELTLCTIDDNNVFVGGDYDTTCTGNSIIDNDFTSVSELNLNTGFLVQYNTFVNSQIRAFSNNIEISDNGFSYSPKNGIAITFEYGGGSPTIHGNTITDMYTAIRFKAATVSNPDIQDNTFTNCYHPSYQSLGAIISGTYTDDLPSLQYTSGAYVYNNTGFVSENEGTDYIVSSTQVQFAHGLTNRTVPQMVDATFNPAVGDWDWEADATTVTITVTPSGSYTVNWDAAYSQYLEDEGGAGGDNRVVLDPSLQRIQINTSIRRIDLG